MSQGIDVNRGVMIKKHPLGFFVYMYIDKPGTFFSAHEKEIPAEVAAKAGYDITTLGKEKVKRERMAEAMTAIEMELELANSQVAENIVAERGGYKIVGLALGNANIFDDDGNKLNPIPIPQQEAQVLLDHLVPEKKSKGKKEG